MKKIFVLTLLVAVVAISGCIGGDEVETGVNKLTGGYGLEITEFVTAAPEVVSNKLTTIQMTVENKGDYTIDKSYGYVYLIRNSDWTITQDLQREYTKDLKSADPEAVTSSGTALFRWTGTSPETGQDRTDTFIGRIYYDYQTQASGNIWVYPEIEASALLDKGENLPISEFSYTKGPVSIDVEIVPDPVITTMDGEIFSLVIDLKNIGNGFVYAPETIDIDNDEIEEEDLNIVVVSMEIPEGITIEEDCYDNVQLIAGETSIICDLTVDSEPTTKKTEPITITADYGYWTESTARIKILGR